MGRSQEGSLCILFSLAALADCPEMGLGCMIIVTLHEMLDLHRVKKKYNGNRFLALTSVLISKRLHVQIIWFSLEHIDRNMPPTMSEHVGIVGYVYVLLMFNVISYKNYNF